MLKRALFYQILPHLLHKNAIVITGMRQVGKTSLMRLLAEQWKGKMLWYDFDNPLDSMVFENLDYRGVYADLRREAGSAEGERILVCVDEIQNFPEATRVVKYLIDHFGVKFILTGSSNFYLRNLFPESLSGRKFLFVLHPLSYREYLYFQHRLSEKELVPDAAEAWGNHSMVSMIKRKSLYHDYLEFGGFPEVALTDDSATRFLILKNIFSSFFEKDIKVFSELRDVRELRDLIILLAQRNANILDVTRLSSELGITRAKVYNYLELLEGTFFLRLIPKHTRSRDRSVAGGKKVYFSDTGILNLVARANQGQLLETAVANQLVSYGELSYYNKRNTAEIDFILNGEHAFEVKQKAIPADLQKLNKLAGSLGISRAHVISNTPVEGEGVVYPWFF